MALWHLKYVAVLRAQREDSQSLPGLLCNTAQKDTAAAAEAQWQDRRGWRARWRLGARETGLQTAEVRGESVKENRPRERETARICLLC